MEKPKGTWSLQFLSAQELLPLCHEVRKSGLRALVLLVLSLLAPHPWTVSHPKTSLSGHVLVIFLGCFCPPD